MSNSYNLYSYTDGRKQNRTSLLPISHRSFTILVSISIIAVLTLSSLITTGCSSASSASPSTGKVSLNDIYVKVSNLEKVALSQDMSTASGDLAYDISSIQADLTELTVKMNNLYQRLVEIEIALQQIKASQSQ